MSLSDQSDPVDYVRLTQLAAEATPGPWLAMEEDDGWAVWHDDGRPGTLYICNDVAQGHSDGEADAAFIAAVSPDVVTRLLADLECLREEAEDRSQKMFPATWGGFRAFIDEWYPDDIFPASDKGLGPEFVVAARTFDDLRSELVAVRQENEQLRTEVAELQDVAVHAESPTTGKCLACGQTWFCNGWIDEACDDDELDRLRAAVVAAAIENYPEQLRVVREQLAAIRAAAKRREDDPSSFGDEHARSKALGRVIAILDGPKPPCSNCNGHGYINIQKAIGWASVTCEVCRAAAAAVLPEPATEEPETFCKHGRTISHWQPWVCPGPRVEPVTKETP